MFACHRQPSLQGSLRNVDASICCIRIQCSVALLMDHTPWLWYVRRRNMCRLACNVCGVTTVNGSSVGSSSCCRLSTRCSLWSLRIVQVQQVSLHSFGYCTCSVWTTISLSVYLSVLSASARLQHLTTSSFCPEALLCFYCYTVSHRLASMGVSSAATCLGEHTISPTKVWSVR